MLFQSSIRRELARSFGATFVVLITIVLTIMLIRTLGQASRGIISPQDVMLFMAYAALGRLPTILSLSLFVSMVATLSRMYRDSEMVVWFASGRSLFSFISPMFRFAWPILLIITVSSLYVWPWTNVQKADLQLRYSERNDLDRIAPGQFQESSGGNRVFFIDRDAKSDQKASSNVFIASNEKGKESITTARSGRVQTEGEKKLLVLENGQRVESAGDDATLKVSEFEEYGVAIADTTVRGLSASDAKTLFIPSLVKSPTRENLTELAWRLGLALAAVNFVVLAVALASVNPRGGRSGNLIFVILTFLVYNNMVNLGQSWMSSGAVTFAGLMIFLHAGVLLLGLLWLVKRNENWTVLSAIRRRASLAKP